MFIYNVTIKVDWKIHEDWLRWMKEVQLPAMLATGDFQKHQFVRLIDVEDADGPTYAIQYYAIDKSAYQNYADCSSSTINRQAFSKWGDRFVMFETLMEVVH